MQIARLLGICPVRWRILHTIVCLICIVVCTGTHAGTAAMDGYIARVKTTLAFSDGLVEGTGTKHAPHAPREHRSWSEYSRTLQTYPDDVGTVRCRLNKGWQSCTPAQSTVPATNASVVFVPLDSPVFDASAIMACVHSSKP